MEFRPNVRDGFQLLQTSFALSTATIEELDSPGITEALICDLFVNYKLRISDVINLAHEDYQTVVGVLLKQGIIQDRRRKPRPAKPVGSNN